MNCREIAVIAPLYLSGELEGSERARVDGHLAGCRNCTQEMERLVALDARLRDATSGNLPDATAVQRSVQARIGAGRRWTIGIAMAAGVLLAAVVGYRVTRPERLFEDAALDHRQEVMEHKPRRWRTDGGEIAKLAARYELPDVARLAPAGYRLEHAKMCGIDGEPALHLVYTDGAREVSVFVRSRNGNARPIRAVRVGSEHLAGFQTDRVEAIVAMGGSGDECIQFARFAAGVL